MLEPLQPPMEIVTEPYYANSFTPWRRQSRCQAANFEQPRPYNNPGYLQNGAGGLPPPGAAPLLPNQGRVIQTGPIRVLCIADVRGKPSLHWVSIEHG